MEKFLKLNILSLALILCFVSCEGIYNKDQKVNDLIDVEKLENSVNKVIVQPLKEDDLNGSYKVSIHFDKTVQNYRMPDGFKIFGVSDTEPLRKNPGNELLYSGETKNKLIMDLYKKAKAGGQSHDNMQGFSIGCDVSFTSPGEYDSNCGSRCSETSMLGGETWFCVCVHNCRVEVEFF